jgi:hypothetical protein
MFMKDIQVLTFRLLSCVRLRKLLVLIASSDTCFKGVTNLEHTVSNAHFLVLHYSNILLQS